MKSQSHITIVTVVYNDAYTIEKTILSVRVQKFTNYEFIVIDGGSVDGTIDIVNYYSDKIDIIITEPDRGLYDAMNKGLNLATGKWIYFLNSGDYLLDRDTLQNVSALLEDSFDVVHFNCKVTNNDGQEVNTRRYPKNIQEITRWPCIQHQSVFVRSSIVQGSYGFNLDYKILADYDLFLRLYINGKKFFFYKDIYISNYNSQGISAQKNSIDTLIKELKTIQLKQLKRTSKLILYQLYLKKFLYYVPFGDNIISLLKSLILIPR